MMTEFLLPIKRYTEDIFAQFIQESGCSYKNLDATGGLS